MADCSPWRTNALYSRCSLYQRNTPSKTSLSVRPSCFMASFNLFAMPGDRGEIMAFVALPVPPTCARSVLLNIIPAGGKPLSAECHWVRSAGRGEGP